MSVVDRRGIANEKWGEQQEDKNHLHNRFLFSVFICVHLPADVNARKIYCRADDLEYLVSRKARNA